MIRLFIPWKQSLGGENRKIRRGHEFFKLVLLPLQSLCLLIGSTLKTRHIFEIEIVKLFSVKKFLHLMTFLQSPYLEQ